MNSQLKQSEPDGLPAEDGRLDWSDIEIQDAIAAADPTVLRGLLYYLAGDEGAAATKVEKTSASVFAGFTVSDPEDVKLLREKAIVFLKRYREEGAAAFLPGVAERLARSLVLTVGEDIPAEEIELWCEELGLNPWALGLTWTKAPNAERLNSFRVVVIGAGMGGINAAVHLKNAGIPYTIIERNSGVGGTWFQNVYPGARVDTASRTYTHTYGLDFNWPSPYSTQSDNLRYFNWLVDKFGLHENIVFNTEVTSAIWDEPSGMWVVTTRSGAGTQVLRANAVISAVGVFTTPDIPAFKGMDRFRGESCHSARWPDGLVTKGKRVAVIGTGCTGYQMIPEIARDASHVLVFQRTPQWTVPVKGYLNPFPSQVSWLDRNFPMYKNFIRLRSTWLQGPRTRERMMDIDPEWTDPLTRSAANKAFRDMSVDFIQQKFRARPDLVQNMLPQHPIMSARPVIVDADNCIYDTLLHDGVTLVTAPIERITEDGIVTSDGATHEIDVIVCATGFKVNDFLWPIEVRGRDGVRVEELWAKDGARAYLGTMLPGFPNFFMIFGPNTTPQGGVSLVNSEVITTRYILSCIGYLIAEEKRTIEPTREAYDQYNEELDRSEKRKIYSDKRAHNYYQNSFGRSSVNCPINGLRMWMLLRSLNFDELTVGK